MLWIVNMTDDRPNCPAPHVTRAVVFEGGRFKVEPNHAGLLAHVKEAAVAALRAVPADAAIEPAQVEAIACAPVAAALAAYDRDGERVTHVRSYRRRPAVSPVEPTPADGPAQTLVSGVPEKRKDEEAAEAEVDVYEGDDFEEPDPEEAGDA